MSVARHKAQILRELITSPDLQFAMEAHSGISARIVEDAGFRAVWASGLAISAALGVRDRNEASWTQVLEVAEFMNDATSNPVLLDGDTGFGNFNSVRRLVRKLQSRGIAGVCLEDKVFPKTNSFIGGATQPLADIEEFSGKIRAAKDSQTDDSFVVVARVEAFIAGRGLGEALGRAEAYRTAGADAILIHSARADASEIAAFTREWAGRLPVVIVPTKYHTTPVEEFRKMGVSLVIWANHMVRASISAMQEAARTVYLEQSISSLETSVVSLNEVFRLQNEAELGRAERRYLPGSASAAPTNIIHMCDICDAHVSPVMVDIDECDDRERAV